MFHRVLCWNLFSLFCMLHRYQTLSIIILSIMRVLLQLHKSAHITELNQLISRIPECITDLKTWMIQNKLHLNDDKTELMLTTSKKFHNHPSLLPSMQINQVDLSVRSSICSQPRCRSRPNIVFQAAYLALLQSSIPGAPQNQYHSPVSFC